MNMRKTRFGGFWCHFAALVLLCMGFGGHVMAAPISTRAQQALLIDLTTDTVLLDKNADQMMYPSSMSKLMTVYLAFQKIRDGSLRWDDSFLISKKAWKTGGSKMFLEVNTRVGLRDLLQGIITQSGNDACIVLAEGVAGSEEAYVERMNAVAKDMGLKNTHFANVTGLPNPQHYSTARDLSIIARKILTEFPDFYPMYGVREFTYGGITQPNRNPLLGKMVGADGMKTGQTDAGGHGLVASVMRNGRRLLLVVNGLPSDTARAEDATNLLEWGFREFTNVTVVKKDAVVAEADVWLGNPARVPLLAGSDLTLTLSRAQAKNLTAKAVFSMPLPADLKAGAVVGKILITGAADRALEVPLILAKDTDAMHGPARVFEAFRYLLWGTKDAPPLSALPPAAAG
jgi:D-alanyl-D-alanine carboxypeptidase (penicillin-binding protein 5/6)